MKATLEELDSIIEREKRHMAREVHDEAWADGYLEGIDAQLLAEAAICRALEETVLLEGEDAALSLLESIRERVVSGDFNAHRTVQ
ncbi:MAG: hypothetical protein AAGI92_07280 [Pseudomonadota bacterium]